MAFGQYSEMKLISHKSMSYYVDSASERKPTVQTIQITAGDSYIPQSLQSNDFEVYFAMEHSMFKIEQYGTGNIAV